jgi:ABC-2 type transport system permease protein
MKRMEARRYLRIYRHWIKVSLMLFMSHRFNFVMGAVANIIWTVCQLISVKYLYIKIDSWPGWSFQDLVLLLALGQIYVYLSFVIFDINLDKLPEKIVRGELDRVLTKPINAKFAISFERISVAQVVPMLTTVIPLMIYGLYQRQGLSVGNFSLAVVVIILAGCLFYFLSLIVGSINFFVENAASLKEFALRSSLNLARVPLSVFPKGISMFLTFVIPVGFTAYYPLLIIKGEMGALMVIIGELIMLVLLAFVADVIWKMGLKRYSGAS